MDTSITPKILTPEETRELAPHVKRRVRWDFDPIPEGGAMRVPPGKESAARDAMAKRKRRSPAINLRQMTVEEESYSEQEGRKVRHKVLYIVRDPFESGYIESMMDSRLDPDAMRDRERAGVGFDGRPASDPARYVEQPPTEDDKRRHDEMLASFVQRGMDKPSLLGKLEQASNWPDMLDAYRRVTGKAWVDPRTEEERAQGAAEEVLEASGDGGDADSEDAGEGVELF